MRALVTSSAGGWSNTKLTDVELGQGQPDQVLVKIRAVGLNPADNYLIHGRYPGGPRPPFTVGRDACGEVIEAGPNSPWKAGDLVVTIQSTTTDLTHGTLCEQQWIAAENLARKPPGWTDAEAAAAPLVYQTAWKALVDIGGLQPGQPVVITGASGGVGLAAVHLSRAYGATVVALSRSADKQQKLIEAGAHFVFSPEDPEVKERIFKALNVKGVPLVVENVGGPMLTMAVHLLGVHGRVSVVGVLAGIEGAIPIPALMFKRLSIHGVLVTDDSPEKSQKSWTQIVEILGRANIKPIIDSRFPLSDVEAAFKKLGENVFGKVVVEIA